MVRARVHQGSVLTHWIAHPSQPRIPGCPQGSVLTSSLTSRRMEGWSGMALKRVPTTQHFSLGCSSHSFFTCTPLPGHQRPELRDQAALLAPPTGHGNRPPGAQLPRDPASAKRERSLRAETP